jgi:hypothetical protein
MNITKIIAITDLFRKGSAVANKEAWKSGQITASVLGGVVMAGIQVAALSGVGLPVWLNEDVVTAVAGGVVSLVNVVATYVSSEKAGVLPAREQPMQIDGN